jgi:hypothetical protein
MRRLDEAIERWRGETCRIDVDEILRANMNTMGATVDSPRSAQACWVWQNVLRVGDATWWSTAARQLYACGGPWVELSVLQSEADWNRERRDDLMNWFGLLPNVAKRSRTPRPPSPPAVQ